MVSLNLHLHPSHNHNQHNTDIHPYTHKHIITPPHTHEQYEMDSAACMHTYMNGYVCINNKEDEGMDFKRQVRNTKEIYIHICIYFRNNHPVNWENKKLLQVFQTMQNLQLITNLSSLSCVYCENEDHSQRSDCSGSRKCPHHSEGVQLLWRVSRKGIQSHECQAVSPQNKKKRLCVDTRLLCELSVVMFWTCSKLPHWTSGLPLQDRIYICWCVHPPHYSWECGFHWSSNFLKNISTGFGGGQVLLVLLFKPRRIN